MSDEKQETIADIVKDLRRQSDGESAFATELRRTADDVDFGDVDFARAACYAEDAKYLSQIADRIEAAARREREQQKRELDRAVLNKDYIDSLKFCSEVAKREETQLGNIAAMREALEVAKKAICHHARKNHTCDSLAWENSTINANCADILCGHRDLCEAKTAIQKALSAPPRNCDRLFNSVTAIESYQKETGMNKHPVPLWTAAQIYAFIDWLLVLAVERKGDNDGK